jgi:hypothetical protein
MSNATAPPTFVLVPGAGGTSFGWVPVARELTLRGYRALPVELPGHGFDAVFPAGYQCPQDIDRLAGAPSPLAGLTLDDYVANTAPELLARIVYVSAFCCVELPSLLAYAQTPEYAESLMPTPPGLGDPTRTGPCALIRVPVTQ